MVKLYLNIFFKYTDDDENDMLWFDTTKLFAEIKLNVYNFDLDPILQPLCRNNSMSRTGSRTAPSLIWTLPFSLPSAGAFHQSVQLKDGKFRYNKSFILL
jgi:hypothetical protein